jgi:hypothetical protein
VPPKRKLKELRRHTSTRQEVTWKDQCKWPRRGE